jgi:hypothetical protein
MANKSMAHHYWAEAVVTVVYIMNKTPTTIVYGMTIEEKYSGRKPDLSHLKVFGCIAYVHVPDELWAKLDPKAEKCVFIGYSLEQKGYICYNPVTCEMKVNKDVVFDEISNWYANVKDSIRANAHKHVVVNNASQQSQTLSGPRESILVGLLIDHGVVGCVIIAVLQIQVMHHIKEKRRSVSPLVCLTFLQDIHM